MSYTIFADGGARGNPGPAGAGAVVFDERDERIAEVSAYLGERTNNYAEYEAVILAFEKLRAHCGKEIEHTDVVVKMDSELVVRQVNGLYKVRHPVLKEQYVRLMVVKDGFHSVTFTHVPRAENGAADALANAAMDRGA